MSNYTQITFFAPKDALLSGNPAKLIKGADVDPELAAIATAIASKFDGTNYAFANPTGTIGLTAVNGTSNNPMRSDAAPALSQAISPAWTGAHTFSQAQGATRFTVSGPNTGVGWNVVFNDTTNAANRGFIGIGTNTVGGAAVTDFAISPGASGSVVIGTASGGAIGTRFGPNGNVTINPPSSGTALTVNSVANGIVVNSAASNYTITAQSTGLAAGTSFGLNVVAGTNSSDNTILARNQSGVNYFQVRGDGVVQGNDGTSLFELGYKDTPINTQAGSYTAVVSDRDKTVNHSTNGSTHTVPANVFSAGNVYSIRVPSGVAITVAQGASLTLNWAGNGATTGNRTLTGEGIATVLFLSATVATITGAGLS